MKCTDVGLEEESYACTMLLTSIATAGVLGRRQSYIIRSGHPFHLAK